MSTEDKDCDDDACDVSPDRGDTPVIVEHRHLSRSHSASLEREIMTVAYAIGIVVLSFGVVALTITLSVLCFMYPDKANAFLVLLASPIALLVLSNTVKITKLLQRKKERKERNGICDKD